MNIVKKILAVLFFLIPTILAIVFKVHGLGNWVSVVIGQIIFLALIMKILGSGFSGMKF